MALGHRKLSLSSATFRGLLVHDDRRQRIPLWFRPDSAGIYRASASAPALLTFLGRPSDRGLWSLSRRLFPSAGTRYARGTSCAANPTDTRWLTFLLVFALLNQLNGSLPPALVWLPRRAWIGLAIALLGAATSLLLCYPRTMKKTIEEPDLVPASRGFRWMLRFGTSVDTAVLFFTLRSLVRSRQHRLAYAFYWAVVFVLTTFFLRQASPGASRSPMSLEFVGATFMMMCFAVVGMRRVFSLPISLSANWVLRTTQLRSSQEYLTATRRSLLMLAVLPVGLAAALL
jgi:hypothetical protein